MQEFGKESEKFYMKMGARRKQSKTKGKRTMIKRFIKLLAVNPNPVQNLGLSRNAPDEVIKRICNAASNLSHESMQVTPKQKSLFKKYKAPITKLVVPDPTIKQKRQALVQHGGEFFVPLLSSVLGTLGSALFKQ